MPNPFGPIRRIARPIFLSTVLTLPLVAPSVLTAEEPEDPKELARQGMEQMLRAIELMIEMIPQYDVPEVNEQGDIIIRRRNPATPREDDPAEDEPEESQT